MDVEREDPMDVDLSAAPEPYVEVGPLQIRNKTAGGPGSTYGGQ